MGIVIASTSDSKEDVTAAMGGLSDKKPVDDKKPSEKVSDDKELLDNEIEEQEIEEIEKDPEALEEETEEEKEPEELEAKNELDKPKKKGGFQKKIEKRDREIAELKRDNELWRQEALRAKPVQETTVEAKPDQSKKPKPDDFKTVDEYTEALTDWKVDQKLAMVQQKAQEESIKKEVQSKFDKHHDRIEAFKEAHEDFDDEWKEACETIGGERNLPLFVREVIITSEVGPELMNELANDPKELKRLCGLSAINAAKELGKMEAKFSKPSKTSVEKKPTKAAATVKPVRSRGTVSSKGYSDDMSLRDYERMRSEEIKARRARA